MDDPYTYGAIAAVNAMNDVYAMGGEVLLALNIAAFPEDLSLDVVGAILEGGADKVREAGAVIAGGHTIIDEEPKYGLCVTGLVHPARIRTNATAQPGDAILLTKPLGTGILIGAMNDLAAEPGHARACVDQMLALNRAPAGLLREREIHALADVTGFGLAGHAWEVAENSGVRVTLHLGTLPACDGLAQYVAAGFRNGGMDRNRAFFGPRMALPGTLSDFDAALLFDPQTSGGLLIVLPEADADDLSARLRAIGSGAWRVGSVEAAGPAGPGVRVRS